MEVRRFLLFRAKTLYDGIGGYSAGSARMCVVGKEGRLCVSTCGRKGGALAGLSAILDSE